MWDWLKKIKLPETDDSPGDRILNNTIKEANNASTQEERDNIYKDRAKKTLAITGQSLMAIPMLGEFATYGLLGGGLRLGAGMAGSKAGEYVLGKGGDWADKKLGTNWIGTAGRIGGGLMGFGLGTNATTPLLRSAAAKGITMHIPQETFSKLRNEAFANWSKKAYNRKLYVNPQESLTNELIDRPKGKGIQFHVDRHTFPDLNRDWETNRVLSDWPNKWGKEYVKDGMMLPGKAGSSLDEYIWFSEDHPYQIPTNNNFIIGSAKDLRTAKNQLVQGTPIPFPLTKGFPVNGKSIEYYKYLPIEKYPDALNATIGTYGRVKFHEPIPISPQEAATTYHYDPRVNLLSRPISAAEKAGIPKHERPMYDPEVLQKAKLFAEEYGYPEPTNPQEIKNMYRQHNTFFRTVGDLDRVYFPESYEAMPDWFKQLDLPGQRKVLASKGYPSNSSFRSYYGNTEDVFGDGFVFVSPSLKENAAYFEANGGLSHTVKLQRPFSLRDPKTWHKEADWRIYPQNSWKAQFWPKGRVEVGNATPNREFKVSTKHLIPVDIAKETDLGTKLPDYLQKRVNDAISDSWHRPEWLKDDGYYGNIDVDYFGILPEKFTYKQGGILKAQHGNKLLNKWQQLYDSKFGNTMRKFFLGSQETNELGQPKYIGSSGMLGMLVLPEFEGLEFPEITAMHYGVKGKPIGNAIEAERLTTVPKATSGVAKTKAVDQSFNKFLEKSTQEQDNIVRYWNGENFSNYQQLQRNPSQLKRFKNWLKKKK